MERYVCRDIGCANPLRSKWGRLLVQRTDLDTLIVVENRAVDRSGNVIVEEFGRCSNIDDFVENAIVFDLLYAGDAVIHGA